MRNRLLVLASLAFLFASTAQAAPIVYTAFLTGEAEEPPTGSPGTGFARVEYDPVAHTLFVDVVFSGLLANTTAAHIHCCTAVPGAGNVGVATPVPSFPGFPLGVTDGAYTQLFDLTLNSSFNPAFIAMSGGTAAGAEAALAAGLEAGQAYFNIHSTRNPGGEIRGFLVPEPATLTLLGIGVGAGAIARRKRRGTSR